MAIHKQISMFDDTLENNEDIALDSTLKERRGDKLMDVLTGGEITNPKETVEDLLKLVIIEEFNKQWNKHNYILSNITKNRLTDKGLRPVRSAAQVEIIDGNYSTARLKEIALGVLNNLLFRTELKLMHVLCDQFRRIVVKSPDGGYAQYAEMITGISDQCLLRYFMGLTPAKLKEGLAIAVNQSWDWLKFGKMQDIILTINHTDNNSTTYELNVINNVSFEFGTRFIDECLEGLNRSYTYEDGGAYDPIRFEEIANRKRLA